MSSLAYRPCNLLKVQLICSGQASHGLPCLWCCQPLFLETPVETMRAIPFYADHLELHDNMNLICLRDIHADR